MPEALPCFTSLLSPIDAEDFFHRFWSKEHLHISRGQVQSEWLTLRDIDTCFQCENLPAACCNVVLGGVQVPIEEWSAVRASSRGDFLAVDVDRLFHWYLKGATLIVNQAQRSIPRLSHWCRLLTCELGFRVWANIYVTPAGFSGFARHRDDHEVLILQIAGTKLWTICPVGAGPVELRLETGDLLYLPRSMDHSAHSEGVASVHLTLGMSPTYGFDLVSELAAAAKEHPSFQSAVSSPFDGRAAIEGLETDFASRVAALLAEIGIAELLDRRQQSLGIKQDRGWPGRLADILRLNELSTTNLIRLRSGVLFTIRENGASIGVQVAGKTVSVPVFLKECVERITSGSAFVVEQLPGLLSSEGKLEVVARLIRVGLLEIQDGLKQEKSSTSD